MRRDRGETFTNVAAVLNNGSLRRALIAFTVFRPTESAQWIAILVYAYNRGGSREIGFVALGILLPTAALAPFLAQIGDRVNRERALAFAYLAIGVAAGLTALSAALSLPSIAFYAFAAIVNITISMVRPTHLSTLPELADTPAQLTAAYALSSTIEALAIFVGPLLAGLLIAVNGPGAVFGATQPAHAGGRASRARHPRAYSDHRAEGPCWRRARGVP